MDCVFCKIAKGEVPSEKIFENEKLFVFLDMAPAAEGHSLVIPKQHWENIFDIDGDVLCELIKTVKEMSLKIKQNLGSVGVNLIINNGREAGQTVPHFHVHIVPRYERDGLTGADLFGEAGKMSGEEMKVTAQKILRNK